MRKLDVRLEWGDEQVMVGTLAEQERVLYFEYNSAFIAESLPHAITNGLRRSARGTTSLSEGDERFRRVPRPARR